MKLKNKYGILTVFIIIILIIAIFISYFTLTLKSETEEEKGLLKPEPIIDHPSILPDWNDGGYHNYEATSQKILVWNNEYPNLIDYFSIGKSVLGKDIWCIRITNEKNNAEKHSCLIDGCIHGCEWEAGEACLYLSEYLLINFGMNSSINNILNNSNIYIIPLLNPDSRNSDSRFNDNGIDLCRNFDIDFGRLRGSAIRLGKIFGRIKIPIVWLPFFGFLNNCGRKPISEPESIALNNMMTQLKNERFSFYINCHTAVHNFFGPWSAFKPPFEISDDKQKIFDTVGEWVETNTEYENKELSYCASGTAVDWCFYKYDIPSFAFELLSKDYEPWIVGGKHDNLVHWMKTTLPVYMYLLVNIQNLYNWENPDIQPLLPEGVPPTPI